MGTKRDRGFNVTSFDFGTGFSSARSVVAAAIAAAIGVGTKMVVLVYGQSNSSGSGGVVVLSSGANAYGNEMVDNTAARNIITNLHEFGQESLSTAFCDWLSFREPNRRSLTINAGLGGTSYTGLDQGSAQYDDHLLLGLRSIVTASVGQGSSSMSGVMAWVHGEQDELAAASSSQYADYLEDLQTDFQGDFRTLTTQSNAVVPLVYSQITNWGQWGTSRRYGEVAQGQYQAHLSGNSNVVLACPTYMLQFTSSGQNLHHTARGHRRLGEYLAKVAQRVSISGSSWTPLRPSSIVANADRIVVQIEGGDASTDILFDTGTTGYRSFYGFEVIDDSDTAPQISFVSQSGGREITIGLTSTAHLNTLLAYGLSTKHAANNGIDGNGLSAGGNVRDQDPTPSQFPGEDPLRNWLVAFRSPFTSFTAGSEPVRAFAANTRSFRFGSSATTGQSLTARRLPGWEGNVDGPTHHLLLSFWHRRDAAFNPSNESFIFQNVNSHRHIQILSIGSGQMQVRLPRSLTDTTTTFTTHPVYSGSVWHNTALYYSGTGVGNLQKLVWFRNGTWTSGTFGAGIISGTMTTGSQDDFEIGDGGGTTALTNTNMQHVALWRNVDIPSASLTSVVGEIYNGGTPPNLNAVSIGRPNHWWTLDGHLLDSGSVLPHHHAFLIKSGTTLFTASVP